MVMANAFEKYRAQDVNTASPTTLVVMLYTSCIKQLKVAGIAIEKKDYEGANNGFKKAQDIISELMMSLDLKYDISKQLMSLYIFLHDEMRKANMSKDEARIEPMVKILADLKQAWVQVEKECRPTAYAEN